MVKPGEVIDGRFTVSANQPFNGGMAGVFKAKEISTGRDVAVKVPSEDPLAQESIFLEANVLRRLHPHRNIIGLLAETSVGTTTGLVLEWANEDLLSRIARYATASWSNIYGEVVAPLLCALERAHSLDIQHRDVHPGNIMFGSMDAELKLIDFGIAQVQKIIPGRTFARFGNPPYTPQNHNDRHAGYSRDCYAVAVVAMSCIVGRVFKDYDELSSALINISTVDYPLDLLSSCIRDYPSTCPASAGLLRSRLQAWTDIKFPRETSISLLVEHPVGNSFIDNVSPQSWNLVLEDLSAGGRILINDECTEVEVFGENFRAEFVVVDPRAGKIRLLDKVRPARAGLNTTAVSLPFTLIEASAPVKATTWSKFVTRFEDAQAQAEQEREQARREAPFVSWDNFLAAENHVLLRKPSSIRYRGLEQTSDREFRFELESGKSLLSEDAGLVANQNKRNLIRVTSIDEKWIHARAKHAISLPSSGIFSVEYHALKQSLSRKRRALDGIRNCLEPSSVLRKALLYPEAVEAPELSGRTYGIYDEHQALAVDASLGTRAWTMIEGPPGTGKSTTIAQIIKNMRNPDGSRLRILLAAQTHVAIDTVLTKLLDDDFDRAALVRIPSGDIEKIDERVRPLLVEQKVRSFRENALHRSETFLEKYAARYNADHREVRVALYAGILRALLDEVIELTRKLDSAEANTASTIEASIDDVNSADATTRTVSVVTLEDQLKEELSDLLTRVNSLRGQIRENVPELRDALGGSDERSTIIEYEETFRCELARNATLSQLVRLQTDWLRAITAGRALRQAIVQDAYVVAGTCVGLGAMIGNQEFDVCILDEASKALPVEALIPMARAKKWILVGDIHQLPPYRDRDINVNQEDQFWSQKSLLETLPATAKSLLGEDDLPWLFNLKNQRRMCESISQLIGQTFYLSTLIPLRTDKERRAVIAKAYKKPVTWLDVRGTSTLDGSTKRSLYNDREVEVICEQLAMLSNVYDKNPDGRPISVAVIAGYAAQVDRLRSAISGRSHRYSNIEITIASIDSFQGNEKEIALVSLVRGYKSTSLGHLDEKRINVALSRAMDALVIVGSVEMVERAASGTKLAAVLEYIRRNKDGCYLTAPQ